MIKILEERIPVRYLCKYFSVSPSHYYKWKSQITPERLQTKEKICQLILKIFKQSKGTYGAPRIYRELISSGYSVSENTVAKYMKELELDARHKRSYRVQTTDSNHANPIAPRLFKAEENGSIPNSPGKVLAGDITYLRCGDKFLYLAVVIDLFNREVLGWSMGESLETGLVLRALEFAMKKVGPDAEVIFHSDRGSQYASEAYRKFLKNNDVRPSMSRKGNCYDNAFVESWFASLKKERIYRNKYSTAAELRALVFEYIEVWYNKKRAHSSLGHLSPEGYRLRGKSV